MKVLHTITLSSNFTLSSVTHLFCHNKMIISIKLPFIIYLVDKTFLSAQCCNLRACIVPLFRHIGDRDTLDSGAIPFNVTPLFMGVAINPNLEVLFKLIEVVHQFSYVRSKIIAEILAVADVLDERKSLSSRKDQDLVFFFPVNDLGFTEVYVRRSCS